MKPIVAFTSLSARSSFVQRRAAVLGRQMGAPVYLVHVVGTFATGQGEASANARLQLGAARLRTSFGIQVRAKVKRGRLASAIAATCTALRPRVVLIGAARRRVLRDRHWPALAYWLQRRIDAPVLAVSRKQPNDYRQVVLAADLCDDVAALGVVRREFPRAQLHVLHVFQWQMIRPLRFAFVGEELCGHYRRLAEAEAASALRKFVAENKIAGRVAVEATVGDVPTALRVHAAQYSADLMVLSPQRSLLKAALGISVTQRLLNDAPCDVLMVPRQPSVDSAPRLEE